MLNFQNNQALSDESGATYAIDTEFGITSLRVFAKAPSDFLPDVEIAETTVYSTEDDAKAAAEQIDGVATKAKNAMQVANQMNQVIEQLAAQQQRPQFGHQGYALDGNPPVPPTGPTGRFGFK